MSLPPEWTALGPLEDFSIGSLTTQRVGGRQLVVVRRDDGEISCLDNHCPHEGYPLVQGKLDGDTLTCVWHNWKFDVGTGACRLGGEAVRAYPTRVNGSQVE
ncbi:MAG: Rieske (2Fe-2S) protein, partial [Planctomycetes bacterium]|nr:Rieske (2Fe-2S) protein [Planctomycetota bacterium]